MLPEPGTLFDRYRIEAVLGEGGMGRVYRAFDERLQRRVALKILHAAGTSGPREALATDGAARLLREARLAAALDHPNAVAIFDVGEARTAEAEAALPYIAMELIEGRSIRAYVGVREVAVAERVRWLTDIARALGAAHRRNLIHRDVKPENVMIRDDGVVKVLDFGIARRSATGVDPAAATQAAASAGTLTADGVVVGTPFYMAPEQMRGEPLDGRCDQFSWAVVAYELLSGELPWDRTGDALKIVSQVLTFDPPPLRTKDIKIHTAVEAIVAKALSKAPANRFASMEEIVASLDALGMRPTVPPLAPSAIEILGSALTIQSTRTSLATGSASPAATTRPFAKPTRKGLYLGLGATVLAVVTAAAVAGVRAHGRRSLPADAAAPTPTAVTDLPTPPTNVDARAAYEDGMRAFRRGDVSELVRSFKRALQLDPNIAPALMRLGYGILLHHPTIGREYFRRALELRSTLTERDKGLLDAFVPFVQTSPPDLTETRTRLAALAVRYPMDAEIFLELANADRWLSRFEDAIANYEQAVRLDPGFAYAATLEAVCLLSRGDPEGAIAVSKKCEASNPGEVGCFKPRMSLENDDGRCSELQDDARKIILSHPDSAAGYGAAAQALFALGSPMSAVRESVAQARSRMGERATWQKGGQLLEINLETLTGNFSEAEKLEAAREADPSFAGSSDEGTHAQGTWARIELALEEGELSRAADIAAEHVARSQAWSTEVRAVDEPQFQYAQMIRAVLARAKRISPAELDAARTATIASVNIKAEPMAGASLWYALYARPAATPDEAKVALDALPQYEPLPPYWYFPADFAIGEVYRLSGDSEKAIPLLARAANACDAIYYPFENTRAHFALGQALEAKQDTAGACAAYAVVVHRWGQAKPRSVTGERARARMVALKCAPAP